MNRPAERAEHPQRQIEQRRAEPRHQEQKRAAERERNASEPQRRAEPRHETNRKAAQERATPQGRRAEERDRRSVERGNSVDRPERTAERRQEIEHARVKLSMQDRERMHRSFDFRRARVERANFNWHVGHRVPRHVHLLPIPREVIGFFPYYRNYSYFAVGDDICIVDASTYEVVDVIEQGYWSSGPQVAGLHLNASEMALIRDSIPSNFPEATVRLRLALGAEIPDDEELYEFSAIVLDRVPDLQRYRFVVTDEQIVIVDPRDRSIALVFDRA